MMKNNLVSLAVAIVFMSSNVLCKGVPKYILVPKTGSTGVRAEQVLSKGQMMGKAKIRSLEVTFSGDLDAKQKQKLSQFYKVEKNKKVSVNWHLDRVNQRVLPLDNRHFQSGTADKVDMYVIDTGVDLSHSEFVNNKGVWGGNFAEDGVDTDCNGHGTHVASLAVGKEFGVAKNASLIAIKVLDCDGSGWLSSVISGIEYATQMTMKSRRLSVINMSLGGGVSEALDDVVNASVESGVYNVVAAGNENGDACKTSPAGARKAISIAASDSSDKKAWFSNFGRCVDAYAPGVDLKAAWPNNQFATLSGTSMASPVAAGVLAVYLHRRGRVGLNVFYSQMSKRVVKSSPQGTVNRLVFLR
jgi:subtilisin family serine protease